MIAITHELRAKGKFTTTLLGVVTLDDALALILFTFAVMLGGVFISGGELSLGYLWEAVWVILLSTLAGWLETGVSILIDTLFAHHAAFAFWLYLLFWCGAFVVCIAH